MSFGISVDELAVNMIIFTVRGNTFSLSLLSFSLALFACNYSVCLNVTHNCALIERCSNSLCWYVNCVRLCLFNVEFY